MTRTFGHRSILEGWMRFKRPTRRLASRASTLLALALGACRTEGPEASEPAPTYADWLRTAGETGDDKARHDALVAAADALDADDPRQDQLALLLPITEAWAYGLETQWVGGDQASAGEDGYLSALIALKVWPTGFGPMFPPEVNDPDLQSVRDLYRARMLVWHAMEYGLFEKEAYAEAFDLFERLATTYPGNPIPPLYLGEEEPWPVTRAAPPGAPAWAVAQRAALEGLSDVIDFWSQERQAPDGQLGGGWGDDVEVWRDWTPVLLGFDDPSAAGVIGRLADGVWSLSRMRGGYSDTLADVEHSGEDSADTVTPMLHLEPSNPVWQARADALAWLARDVWLARNDRGQVQFPSTVFSATVVDDLPENACDSAYHTRAVQPALLRWQRTGDPELETVFAPWLDTWVDAAARAERDKPAGLLPSALRFPSGDVGGTGGAWHSPGCYVINGAPYAFPRSMGPLLSALELGALQTGEPRYLDPLRDLASRWRDAQGSQADASVEGSDAWIADKVSGTTRDALAKHRAATSDTSYDDILTLAGDAYVKARLTGDLTALEADLERTAHALSVNFRAYTTEVRFTDRLFKLSSKYLREVVDDPVPSPDMNLVYETLTGDLGDPLYLPLPRVRWRTSPRGFAALVLDASDGGLVADVFTFDAEGRSLVALVDPELVGSDWSLACGTDMSTGAVSAGGEVSFVVPRETSCTLSIGSVTR